MFVKILAVLYELHLEYLKKRSDRIHGRYRTAFVNFYRLFDEYTEVCAEYEHMPRSVLGEKEQSYIDAAGGRQSKAYVEMKKREMMAGWRYNHVPLPLLLQGQHLRPFNKNNAVGMSTCCRSVNFALKTSWRLFFMLMFYSHPYFCYNCTVL